MLKKFFTEMRELNKRINQRSGDLKAALDRNTIKLEIHKVLSEHSNFPQKIELLTANLTTYLEEWNAFVGIAEGNKIDSYIKIVGKVDMPAQEYLKKHYEETINKIRNNKLMSQELASKESVHLKLRKKIDVLFIQNKADETIKNETIVHMNISIEKYENILGQINKAKQEYLIKSEEAIVEIHKIYKQLLKII